MKSFSSFWWNFLGDLRNNRQCVWLHVLLTVLGAALGIVLFNVAKYQWWYFNRCQFAEKMVYGGFFALFLSFLTTASLVSLLMVLSRLRAFWWICHLTVFGVGLYFGANCCALVALDGVRGVLYVLLLLAADQSITMATCFCCANILPSAGLLQATKDCKWVIVLQFAGVVAKMLIIFVLLRIITALI